MYRTIDICAGIGGIRRGFELTGKVINVLSAENDKYACKTYQHLYNENPMNDITTDDFKDLVRNVNYDILLAGFPCQAFSAVGKKEGFEDKLRGTIFFHIAEIIKSTRPKSFLLENVEGLINHKKGETFKIILDTLINKLHYHVIGIEKQKDLYGNEKSDFFLFNRENIVLNARNFGLPQNRPRIYLVGFNREKYGSKLDKICFNRLPQKREKPPIYNSLKDVLELKADLKYYLSEGYLETLKKHKTSQESKGNGFGYMVVNKPEIKEPISNALLATGGSGKERNLIHDPQEDIGGIVIKNKKTPINNEGIRLMKPNEWGKLQGFIGYAFMGEDRDKFSFPKDVSNTQQYKQLGNSVAIPVVEEIANKIIGTLDQLEGNHEN
ncbi:MAG: DNA (cytosine-5-)-methyltransferase [Methanobrevibacter sp.]|jgi:DNA (cytosine-5)-methyltransferase 1|nr:DNA (cytosine-5-)-methyltransferase [Candidatus Methanovirga basalitermitum]